MNDLPNDLLVWYCPNSEYIDTYHKGMVSCGALCGATVFSALPEWAKDEVRRQIIKDTANEQG